MIKKLLICTLCALSVTLMSCEKEEICGSTQTNAVEDFLVVSMCNVEMRVAPLVVYQGEELTILVSHKQGERAKATISSQSIGFEEVVTTPATIKKEVSERGKHDIKFTVETDFHTQVSIVEYINCY